MTHSPDDPLVRALVALDRLHTSHLDPDPDPVAALAWQEAWDALHEVLREQDAFVAVVRRGRELIEVMDQYEAVSESEDAVRIGELAEAAEAAEDAFVQALNLAPVYPETEDQLSGEAAHLAALDRFADADEPNEDANDDEELQR